MKLLNEADMVHYKPGERKANIYDVTSFGLFFCFLQHYLNSEEFVACIAKRSKLISILGAAEDISLKKLISETAKLTWAMAYYEAFHSTLADLRIPQSKHDTEHAEDACYFELIRGVGSVEALEWALMTRLLEHLGNRRIRQYIKKLTVEERAEIRNKLVEASESYSSARTVLNHINNLLNKTIQIFDKSDS